MKSKRQLGDGGHDTDMGLRCSPSDAGVAFDDDIDEDMSMDADVSGDVDTSRETNNSFSQGIHPGMPRGPISVTRTPSWESQRPCTGVSRANTVIIDNDQNCLHDLSDITDHGLRVP